MGGGHNLKCRAPTVEREAQSAARNLREQAAAKGISALTAYVHLHVVHGLSHDQIQVALLAGLMLAGRQRDEVLVFESR